MLSGCPAAEGQSGFPPKTLPGLTGLRGIAALWVVLYHYTNLYLPALATKAFGGVIGHGYLAVDLFFILSGFVLAHCYGGRERRADSVAFVPFMGARFARVYPLHILVLALFLALSLAVRAIHYVDDGSFYPLPVTGPRSLSALVANVLMLQGVAAGELSWNYPAWSISLEFAAYLVFPFSIGLLWRASGRALAAAAAAALAAVWTLALVKHGDMNQWDGPFALWRCLPQFVLGCIVYRVWRDRLFDTGRLGTLAVAALVASLFADAGDAVAITLFPLIVLHAVTSRGWTGRVLNSRPALLLGEISYSLYLIHGLVQHTTTHVLNWLELDQTELAVAPSLAIAALMLGTAFGLSVLSYRWFEQPARRWVQDCVLALRTRRLAPQTLADQDFTRKDVASAAG
jgi:peptidoglycan/LPS O-acetylase OafA/YrhL